MYLSGVVIQPFACKTFSNVYQQLASGCLSDVMCANLIVRLIMASAFVQSTKKRLANYS